MKELFGCEVIIIIIGLVCDVNLGLRQILRHNRDLQGFLICESAMTFLVAPAACRVEGSFSFPSVVKITEKMAEEECGSFRTELTDMRFKQIPRFVCSAKQTQIRGK